MLNGKLTPAQFKDKIALEVYSLILIADYRARLLKYEEDETLQVWFNATLEDIQGIIETNQKEVTNQIKKVFLIAALAILTNKIYEEAYKEYKDKTIEELNETILPLISIDSTRERLGSIWLDPTTVEQLHKLPIKHLQGEARKPWKDLAEAFKAAAESSDVIASLLQPTSIPADQERLNEESNQAKPKFAVPEFAVAYLFPNLADAKYIYSYFDPYYVAHINNYLDWGMNSYKHYIDEQTRSYLNIEISKLQALGNIYTYLFNKYYNDGSMQLPGYEKVKEAIGTVLKNFEARIAREAESSVVNEDARALFGYIMMKHIAREEQFSQDKSENVLNQYFLQNRKLKRKVTEVAARSIENRKKEEAQKKYGWTNKLAKKVKDAAKNRKKTTVADALDFASQVMQKLLPKITQDRIKLCKFLKQIQVKNFFTAAGLVTRAAKALGQVAPLFNMVELTETEGVSCKETQQLIEYFEDPIRNSAAIRQAISKLTVARVEELEKLAKKANQIANMNEKEVKKFLDISAYGLIRDYKGEPGKFRQVYHEYEQLQDNLPTLTALVLRAAKAFTLACLAKSAGEMESEEPKDSSPKINIHEDFYNIETLLQLIQAGNNDLGELKLDTFTEKYVTTLEDHAKTLAKDAVRITRARYDANKPDTSAIDLEAEELEQAYSEDVAEQHKKLASYLEGSYLSKFRSNVDYYADFTGVYETEVKVNEKAIQDKNLESLEKSNARFEKVHSVMEKRAPKIFDKNQAQTERLIQEVLHGFRKYEAEALKGKHGENRIKQITQFFASAPAAGDKKKLMTLPELAAKLAELERELTIEASNASILPLLEDWAGIPAKKDTSPNSSGTEDEKSEDTEERLGELPASEAAKAEETKEYTPTIYRYFKTPKLYKLTLSAIEKIRDIEKKKPDAAQAGDAAHIQALYQRAFKNKEILTKNWFSAIWDYIWGVEQNLEVVPERQLLFQARP